MNFVENMSIRADIMMPVASKHFKNIFKMFKNILGTFYLTEKGSIG